MTLRSGRWRRQTLGGLVLGVLLIGTPVRGSVDAAQLSVGTAKIALTPPGKFPLAGYSRRKGKPATGIHDPVFVRAMVIQDGRTTVALASCDLLIIDERLFDAVRNRLASNRPDVPPLVLLAATHTHSGPGAYGQKFLEKLSMGHFDPAVFEWLVSRITEAVLTASAHLQPVTARYATMPTTGLIVNRVIHDGVTDPDVTVLSFHDAEGRPIGVITNFSAHPTTLGAWNRMLSADYPGVLTRMIEARFPTATCLFFAGAVGDQAPVKRGDGFERMQLLGGQLAQQLIGSLEQPTHELSPSVQMAERVVRLPPARVRLPHVTLPTWFGRLLVDDDARLSVVAVGQAVLLGVPCDLSAELGLELKAHARAAGYQPMVVGFADDYIGYCMPERVYASKHYEAYMALNGPSTGSMVVGELEHMIDRLVTSDR